MQMHTPGPDLRIAKQDRRDITKYRYSTNRTNSTDRTNRLIVMGLIALIRLIALIGLGRVGG